MVLRNDAVLILDDQLGYLPRLRDAAATQTPF